MKTLLVSLMGILLACCLTGPSWAGSTPDKDLTKQISDILAECKKITAGTTRAELLKVFTQEGGVFSATHCTFVHRRCACIKVNVDFILSDPKRTDERPTDIVSQISKPYLEEWSIID